MCTITWALIFVRHSVDNKTVKGQQAEKMTEKNLVSSINLPIVDYENVVSNNVESRRNESTKLVDAFTNFGFAMVENIEGYNEEELLDSIKWFYYDVTPQVISPTFSI